ncbi:MAG TPA: shikimate kinase [Oligoflexia bacterium]|nr:shikimate kinase [Oligoflexia bacterium]HMP47283.1 shikimate kinase [Oligoflexia bacterium]
MSISKHDSILLIGFMGSGKSTVGRILAETIKKSFIDLDDKIVSLSSHSSVYSIIKKEGELFFRDLEEKALSSCILEKYGVIALGGGALVWKSDTKILDTKKSLNKNKVIVIYLETPFNVCKKRVENELIEKKISTRPLFEDPLKAENLYKERIERYQKLADIKIRTSDKTPGEIADTICKQISQLL